MEIARADIGDLRFLEDRLVEFSEAAEVEAFLEVVVRGVKFTSRLSVAGAIRIYEPERS